MFRVKIVVLMVISMFLLATNGCTLSPAPVPKTGQTTSYATGDDGDLQRGVAWPNPRFTDNEDGTVTDNLTGLIWLKDTVCMATNYPEFDNDEPAGDGKVTWQHALDFVAGINAGTYPDCGASYTDWRLPNERELISLIHNGYGFYEPAVPDTAGTGHWSEGDPFNMAKTRGYWSSTTFAGDDLSALTVSIGFGSLNFSHKTRKRDYSAWPVRGPQ